MIYSLTMYILRFYAAAMDVMRYQVASGVDIACEYSPTRALAPASAVTSQNSCSNMLSLIHISEPTRPY